MIQLSLLGPSAWAEDPIAHDLVRYTEIADGREATMSEGFIRHYQAEPGFTLDLGDVLTLGVPGGTSATATGRYAAGTSGAVTVGTGVSTAIASSWYTQIYNGTQSATMAKAVLVGLSGVPDPALFMAPASIAGTQVRVVRLKLAGTKRRPAVWAECEFVDLKSRANSSGLITVGDVDHALRLGEIESDENITRDLAIRKLEEAKKLLELEVLTQAQFDAEKAKYVPYITGN